MIWRTYFDLTSDLSAAISETMQMSPVITVARAYDFDPLGM
jgi:hypothetical protein